MRASYIKIVILLAKLIIGTILSANMIKGLSRGGYSLIPLHTITSISLLAIMLIAANANAVNVPRSEHPMPQVMRAEWVNLNGSWEFAETDGSEDSKYLGNEPYPDHIIVPFCRESSLSGLGRKGFVKNVWYRRTFALPAKWKSPRTKLHIGASDWHTRVWLNGKYVGDHKGGSAPFAFDITKYLVPGQNRVVIHAYDDTRSGTQALGKQASQLESSGCVYTRTTGIWQTVWLEGVGSSYISDYRLESDPHNSRVFIKAEVDGPCDGLTVKATAYAGKKVVGTAEVPADWRNSRLVLNLSDKRLWSIEDPFLYDLKLALIKNGRPVDELNSYFGLRTVTIKGAAILINGKAVFQRTVLDQGFYPDGIWTAPSDEALRRDIDLSMAAGFNGARLHQKVFEPRLLYWADRMGYLVWGEFPNWGLNYANPACHLPVVSEWGEIVRRDRNHPSIIGWCPFNETPGEAYDIQGVVVNLTRLLDPTRPVIETSGWTHGGVRDPEVLDSHDYNQDPASFRAKWLDSFVSDISMPERYKSGSSARSFIPFFVSEYGGIGWDTGAGGWGYGNNSRTLDEFYARYEGLTNTLLDNRFMFGFCYTQLTDVEQERNGIYTYDRKPKFDIDRIRKINSRKAAYEIDPPVIASKLDNVDDWKVLVGAAPDGESAREWRYTLAAPANGWQNAGFDGGNWKTGMGAFGRKPGSGRYIKTTWTTSDIWLRQEFTFDGSSITKAQLVIHYDNATKIYLNGSLIWSREGWNDSYDGFDVTKTVKSAIKPGKNTIAIHCHQDEGGQFIDMALLVK